MTKVKFLIDNQYKTVFAFFPEMDYNVPLYGKDMKTCYAHLGQHSACLLQYANECKEATPDQYEGLLKELEGQGYDDLNVINDSLNSELQYLKNSLSHHKLDGYKVHEYHQSDNRKKKKLYFVTAPDGTSLTGHWSYSDINHFILGYGKAKNECRSVNEFLRNTIREISKNV